MKQLFVCLILLASLFYTQQSVGQDLKKDVIKWQFDIEKNATTNGYSLIINGQQLDPEWHIWVLDMESDFLIPTQVIIDENADIIWDKHAQVTGDIHSFSDEVFGEVAYYTSDISIVMNFTSSNENTESISGEIVYQACNSNTCLPPRTEKFSVQLKE